MAAKSLPGYGQALQQIQYKDKWDWFMKLNKCDDLWKAQPSYLLSQEVLLAGALLTLLHSLVKRGRWPYVWFSGLLIGIFIELFNYFTVDINNVWHSQTPLMFFGMRLPVHVVFLYAVFVYHAAYAVSRLQMPSWSEPFAIALLVVLLGMPYDIIGIKFLHWSYHDTDPNIADRYYWVPWIIYILRAIATVAFMILFQITTKMFKVRADKWTSVGFPREMLFSLMSCMIALPVSFGLVFLIQAGLHDLFGIHSEVIFFLLMAIFITIVWNGDRAIQQNLMARITKIDWLLILHLLAHFGLYLGLAIWGKPEAEVSIGLHEPIVACDRVRQFKNILGVPLVKREGLCISDFNEDYFNFKCMSKKILPEPGTIWYTACGTAFRNRNEYIAVLAGIFFMAMGIFYNLYFKGTLTERQLIQNKRKSKMN